jgi:uncharacterized BrkB/YihY/UPF0761 family membrane protein
MSRIQDAKLRLQEQRERSSATLKRVQEQRGPDSLVACTVEMVDLDRRRAGGLIAGGIAFRAFLWLVPTSLFAAGVLSFFRDTSHERPDEVARKLGLGGVAASSVADAVDQSNRHTIVLIALGAFFMLYFGLSLLRALRIACVLAWELPPVRRPHTLRDGAIVSLALLAQLTAGATASALRSGGAGDIWITVASAAFTCAIWLGIAQLLPHGDAPISALLPGAAIMMIALQALAIATVYYFARRIETSGNLYGPLGVAATLLLWLYVIARVFVASMFLDAALWRRRQRLAARTSQSGDDRDPEI